jgi:uncharacterized protein
MDATLRCPLCRKSVRREGNPFRPFCSERCQLIDLGGWASERYRIPLASTEAEPADDAESTDEQEPT